MTEEAPASPGAHPRDPAFAIVGAGRVGISLGVLLTRAGRRVSACSAPSEKSRSRAAELIGCPAFEDPAAAAREAGCVLVTVPDDRVEEVAAGLASAGAVGPGSFVVHTAGSLRLGALAEAASAGARILAIHVLQSIPDAERGIERIPGSWFGVTCDPDLEGWAQGLVTDLRGRVIWVPDQERVSYHAAAVIASNYLVTLAAMAAEAFGHLEPYLPLMRGTLDNLEALGAEKALTGPLVRGDAGTIRRHLEALSERRRLSAAYRALGAVTLEYASDWRRVGDEHAERVRLAIEEPA